MKRHQIYGISFSDKDVLVSWVAKCASPGMYESRTYAHRLRNPSWYAPSDHHEDWLDTGSDASCPRADRIQRTQEKLIGHDISQLIGQM